MTLHPFGDNFTEQREKYTLSGVIYCVKKGSKGGRCAIMWGELLEECATFLRNTACAAVGIQKCPQRGGMSL